MGSRSELEAILRDVKRLSDAETRQREIVTELRRNFKDAEHEIRLLENRVELLEQAGRRVDIALPLLAREAK